MKKTYTTTAPAKINLFLRVCGKYDNGYHRLYMLMQSLSLGDEISVEFDDGRGFDIEIESGVPIPHEKDLGYKAAKAFYDAWEDKLKTEAKPVQEFPYTFIREVKKVPSQAGLGGGSSDAASVLKILQEHFGNPLTDDELLNISSRLGADVPFFLTGGTCICEGIGEKITKLPDLKGVNVLLVKPEAGVPTGECYALSDEMYEPFDEEEYKKSIGEAFLDEGLAPAERIKKASRFLINDLQAPAERIAPVITGIIGSVKRTGPCFAAMTGSGSCVFGIYEDEKTRDEAEALLKADPQASGCQIIPACFS